MYFSQESPLDLFGSNSKNILKRFKISKTFSETDDPESWNEMDKYEKVRKSIRVVNDTAGSGVKLMEEFNDKFEPAKSFNFLRTLLS